MRKTAPARLGRPPPRSRRGSLPRWSSRSAPSPPRLLAPPRSTLRTPPPRRSGRDPSNPPSRYRDRTANALAARLLLRSSIRRRTGDRNASGFRPGRCEFSIRFPVSREILARIPGAVPSFSAVVLMGLVEFRHRGDVNQERISVPGVLGFSRRYLLPFGHYESAWRT